ncbi:hypothetical protein DM860_009286 [Cuscuta australis]|uniref:Uncharacterized protein n=1 Tax=Cuscuta australis TaxID=267555 RepID=A0A328DF06_9ASTE|nr:hypothetical protein DM860_009286 [Cuscuta australis]
MIGLTLHAIREIARGDITGSSVDEPDLFPAGFGREVEGRGLVVPWCNDVRVELGSGERVVGSPNAVLPAVHGSTRE